MGKYKIVLLVLLLTGILAGCENNHTNRIETEQTKKGEVTVGLSMDSLVIERWQRDRDVFVATAKKGGVSVNVQNAHGIPEQQIEQIEYLISEGVDSLVVLATDSSKLADCIRNAHEKGIKVIAYDRIVKNANVDLYMTFDSRKVGELMGDAVNHSLKKEGGVYLMMGSEVDENVEQVQKGIKSVLRKDIHVVGSSYAKMWKAEDAFLAISEYLQEHDTLDAIICGNDDLAGQAVRALSEKRLSGKTIVVGQDADVAGCQRIVEGTQYMTVYKGVTKMAEDAANAAIAFAKGYAYPSEETYFDGMYDVPYIKYEPVAVTRTNLDKEVINSGFHLESDIYLHSNQSKKEQGN